MKNSHKSHLRVAKRILRYIGGICSDRIFYSGNDPVELFGYTNSNWVGDTVERKNTSGYAFFIGYGMFSYNSKKQQVITLFTTEAKFSSAAITATQVLWLHQMFVVLHYMHVDPPNTYSVCNSATD